MDIPSTTPGGQEEVRPPGKTYSLSKQEHEALLNLHNLAHSQEYLATLVKKDMQLFVDKVVRPRLNIPDNVIPQMSLRAGTIFVPEVAEPVKDDKKSEPVSDEKSGPGEKR